MKKLSLIALFFTQIVFASDTIKITDPIFESTSGEGYNIGTGSSLDGICRLYGYDYYIEHSVEYSSSFGRVTLLDKEGKNQWVGSGGVKIGWSGTHPRSIIKSLYCSDTPTQNGFKLILEQKVADDGSIFIFSPKVQPKYGPAQSFTTQSADSICRYLGHNSEIGHGYLNQKIKKYGVYETSSPYRTKKEEFAYMDFDFFVTISTRNHIIDRLDDNNGELTVMSCYPKVNPNIASTNYQKKFLNEDGSTTIVEPRYFNGEKNIPISFGYSTEDKICQMYGFAAAAPWEGYASDEPDSLGKKYPDHHLLAQIGSEQFQSPGFFYGLRKYGSDSFSYSSWSDKHFKDMYAYTIVSCIPSNYNDQLTQLTHFTKIEDVSKTSVIIHGPTFGSEPIRYALSRDSDPGAVCQLYGFSNSDAQILLSDAVAYSHPDDFIVQEHFAGIPPNDVVEICGDRSLYKGGHTSSSFHIVTIRCSK